MDIHICSYAGSKQVYAECCWKASHHSGQPAWESSPLFTHIHTELQNKKHVTEALHQVQFKFLGCCKSHISRRGTWSSLMQIRLKTCWLKSNPSHMAKGANASLKLSSEKMVGTVLGSLIVAAPTPELITPHKPHKPNQKQVKQQKQGYLEFSSSLNLM